VSVVGGKGPLARLTTESSRSALSRPFSDNSRERSFIEGFAALSEKRRQDENSILLVLIVVVAVVVVVGPLMTDRSRTI
jgi:hypothetical protein